MFDDYFKQIEATQVKQENDYIQNGLIYCGNCHTPKQCHVPLNGREYIMPCVCKCKQAELNKIDKADAEQKRINRIEHRRENGLPDKKYQTMTFEKSTENLEFAKRYVANWNDCYKNNTGLMILGDRGTGKTYAAACIANALIDKGVFVYMDNVISICDRMNTLFDNERDVLLEKIKNCKLLIIDDIGAENSNEFTQSQLYNVLDTRIRTDKPLIITSNLTRAELKNTDLRVSRTYDRLIGACHPVEMKGESKRKQIANERYKQIKQTRSYDFELYKKKAQDPVYQRRTT